tara:strand:- start:770 stop:1003 length:234 start_codon:yes stop_codon:yes gene_type:complete
MSIIDEYSNILQDELKYIVKKIKKQPITTRNNYGNYYSEIINLHEITSLNYKIIAELLIRAGGNKTGINDAMRIINQ